MTITLLTSFMITKNKVLSVNIYKDGVLNMDGNVLLTVEELLFANYLKQKRII
ncbi:UNVERIFIED_CONTAM: hypothetical protein GTU68_010912 [Idotea baltica]|nr:hypothetical protein [Idotea baltica]